MWTVVVGDARDDLDPMFPCPVKAILDFLQEFPRERLPSKSIGRDPAEDQGDIFTTEVEIGRLGQLAEVVESAFRIREIGIRLDEGSLPDGLGMGRIDRVLAQQAQKEINSHMKISQ
jgi:hypothetical protein